MSYIGQGLPADVFSGFTTDAFTGDGSATTFTLSKAPFSEDGLIVVINNVIQRPTTNFTVSGTTLTIVGTAVADGDVIYAIHTSGAVPSTLASKVDVNGVSDAVILDADGDSTISADSDDQIDFKVGGSDVLTLGPSNLSVDISGNIRLDAGDNGEIRLLDDGTQYGALKVDSSRLKIQGTVSDADMLFAVNDGGSEVTALTLDSSEAGLAIFHTGVAIGGTGAANTLDDYEVGTFTPTLATTGTNFSSIGYATQTGEYVKVGDLVIAHARVTLNSFTAGSPSGNVVVGSLPFTSKDTTDMASSIGFVSNINFDISSFGTIDVGATTSANNTRINLTRTRNNGVADGVPHQAVTSSSTSINAVAIYKTA